MLQAPQWLCIKILFSLAMINTIDFNNVIENHWLLCYLGKNENALKDVSIPFSRSNSSHLVCFNEQLHLTR
jgi:hypothetical protein